MEGYKGTVLFFTVRSTQKRFGLSVCRGGIRPNGSGPSRQSDDGRCGGSRVVVGCGGLRRVAAGRGGVQEQRLADALPLPDVAALAMFRKKKINTFIFDTKDAKAGSGEGHWDAGYSEDNPTMRRRQ